MGTANTLRGYEDRASARKERILVYLVVAAAVLVSVTEIANCFIVPLNYLRWMTILVVFDLASAGLLVLNKMGYARFAASVFIIITLIIIFTLSWSAGGVKAPALLNIPVIIIAAGLLLDWRAGMVCGALSLAGGTFLVIAEYTGLLPVPTVSHSSLSLWLNFILVILVITLLHYMSLSDLNKIIVEAKDELILRTKVEENLRKSEKRLMEAQRITHTGNWELNHITKKLFWSDEIFHIFEINKNKFEASYDAFFAAVHPEDRETVDAVFKESVKTRVPYRITHRLIMADGRLKYVHEQGETYCDPRGAPLRSVGTVQDITERTQAEETIRESLREKETLLRELSRRTGNNMQIISSMINLSSEKISAPEVLEMIKDVDSKIHTMGMVHQKLYRSRDLSFINFKDYIREVSSYLAGLYRSLAENVSISVRGDEVFLFIDIALPLGIIVNELITNALKHAFPENKQGKITIRLSHNSKKELVLSVADDGVGLPAGFSPWESASPGLQIVHSIVKEQLRGSIHFRSDRGTTCSVTINTDRYSPRI